MELNHVFLLLLLGHVIGDFYLQSNSIADNKDKSFKLLVLHGLEYTLCFALVLLMGLPLSLKVLCLLLSASLGHFAVDLIKSAVLIKADSPQIRRYAFVIDQLLHIAALILIWSAWGSRLSVFGYLERSVLKLPAQPLLMIVGLLIILRPVGIFIGKGILWDFNKQDAPPDDTQKNAGKMIGYLERIIVFFLLLFGQYSAIAFVLTAKSVARFKEIENNKCMAEYYLIGTLLSIVSVFVVALCLGLIGKAP